MAEQGESAPVDYDGPQFELIFDEELAGFETATPTAWRQVRADYRVPSEYQLAFPDGREVGGVSADTRLFVMRPLNREHGIDIVANVRNAAHIQELHIDAHDSGSFFLEGTTLIDAMALLAEHLPRAASEGNYDRKPFYMAVQGFIGWENLLSIDQLVEDGVVNRGDARYLHQRFRDAWEIHRDGDDRAKEAFIEEINQQLSGDNLFIKLIRPPDNVMMPHVYGELRLTNVIMAALSTNRRENYRRLHTLLPASNDALTTQGLGLHPIPGQFRTVSDPSGGKPRINEKAFKSSAWAWWHHAFIISSSGIEKPR